MHYEKFAFAKNRQMPTITARNGRQLGNSHGFTKVIRFRAIIPIIPITNHCLTADRHPETEPLLQVPVQDQNRRKQHSKATAAE